MSGRETAPPLLKEYAKRFRQFVDECAANGDSQREMARKTDIHFMTISAAALGKNFLRVEQMYAIARIYHLSLDWLIMGKGDMWTTATKKAAAHKPEPDEPVMNGIEDALLKRLEERLVRRMLGGGK